MDSTSSRDLLRTLKSSYTEKVADSNPLIRKVSNQYKESLGEAIEASKVATHKSKTNSSKVLSFRLTPEQWARFSLLVGRSISKKITNLMDYKSEVDRLLSEQVRTLRNYASQFKDKNLLAGNISEDDLDKIITASKTITYIAHAIQFNHAIHGKFMTLDELEKVEAIIRFGKKFNQ